MKTKHILTSGILALTLLAATPCAFAQTAVPNSLSYQGRISDASGNLVGNPTPVNRTVIFRVWDSPSATAPANLLYSEQQVVTIASGEFNVLVGQGAQVGTEPKIFDTVFNGAQRFLGVTVDDGTAAADPEITPRQQLVTSAFAFRARTAEGVTANAITPSMLAAGAVTANSIAANTIDSTKLAAGAALSNIAANSIDGTKLAASGVTATSIADNAVTTAKIQDGGVGLADHAANSVDSSKIVDGSITGADIANSAVTLAKLDASSIGLWSAGGANVFRASGNVGIGTSTPSEALDLNGNMKIAGANVLEFGGGVAGRATNSGKIGYQSFTPGALDIVGAGTGDGSNWRIKMWATGGTEFTGGITTAGGITTGGPIFVNGSTPIAMTEDSYNSEAGVYSGNTWTLNPRSGPAYEVGIRLYGQGAITQPDTGGTLTLFGANIGIRSNAWIAARMGFMAYSDRRIKKDIQTSEPAADLAAIERLKVTNYRMVDHADGGMAWRKGFIAQEVEKVIPGAVTRSVEFVPDIFSVAKDVVYDSAAKTLSLVLVKDHDLKTGERVRLHIDGKRHDLTVSAVPSAREFVVEKCESAPEKVLVYGRQVNDFRTVDYDRIFTTSVGALQELKKEKDREVKSLRDENTALRNRLAALEADHRTRDAKMDALEKLVLSIKPPEVRTVSLKAGE